MKDKEFAAEKIRSQYVEAENSELDALKALDARVKKPALMTNEQIREGGYMEDIIRAMEHEPAMPDMDAEKAYQAIEEGVVDTYQKIENTFISGYKKVEQGAVTGFRKVSDKFIEKFFSREGETVEETRKRLSRK